MGAKTKRFFRCMGCRARSEEGTEYIDLSRVKNVDEVLHINDLVVAKPDLYLERPKTAFATKKSKSSEANRLGAVAPTYAMPLKSKWPSEISSDDSCLKGPQYREGPKKEKKLVVPLSNISGFLEGDYEQQRVTISQSIAIAENIYQNERRQIMSQGKSENKSTQTTNYTASERVDSKESSKHGPSRFQAQNIWSFLDSDSEKTTASAVGSGGKQPEENRLSHICDVSDFGADEESLASRVWNMFVSASSVFRGAESPRADAHDKTTPSYEKAREIYASRAEAGAKAPVKRNGPKITIK